MKKKSTLPPPIRMLKYALPYKRRILLTWCAVAGLTGFQLIGPILVRYAIDTRHRPAQRRPARQHAKTLDDRRRG